MRPMDLDYRGAAPGLASQRCERSREGGGEVRTALQNTKLSRCAPPWREKIGKMVTVMQCPRCKSLRIQLGYKDKSILARLAGGNEFLCNNCGLEFKSFDSAGKMKRKPATEKDEFLVNRRRAPRYKARLPASISLAEIDPASGQLVRSIVSRGRCETISKLGVALSFTGSRFKAEDLKTGRLLFVTITLPDGTVDAVVTTVTHERVEKEDGAASWFVRGAITQMTEGNSTRLASYLEKRGNEAPLFKQE
jgi:hypothetical protein